MRAAFRILFRGDGVFAERLDAPCESSYADEALVDEVLAFIDAPSKRGLIRSAVHAQEDDQAA